jgi:hypothetical protein
MKRLLLGAAALLAVAIVLVPEDASAYWRGGWRGPGWGGYRVAGWGPYRPIYGPWAGPPVVRLAPVVALAQAPIVVTYPASYGYATPYPVYGAGFYGGYYGYGRYYGYRGCVTDDGYRRYHSCDR